MPAKVWRNIQKLLNGNKLASLKDGFSKLASKATKAAAKKAESFAINFVKAAA